MPYSYTASTMLGNACSSYHRKGTEAIKPPAAPFAGHVRGKRPDSQRTFHHRLEARIPQGTLLHEVLPHRVFVFLGLAPA